MWTIARPGPTVNCVPRAKIVFGVQLKKLVFRETPSGLKFRISISINFFDKNIQSALILISLNMVGAPIPPVTNLQVVGSVFKIKYVAGVIKILSASRGQTMAQVNIWTLFVKINFIDIS
jgi:hypothetical protein